MIASIALLTPTIGVANTVKFAVVIGNNQGRDPDRTLRFAEQDAVKFYQTLTELGGFEKNNTVLLLGATAASVTQAFSQIEKKIDNAAEGASVKTLFLVYYSGHAEGDALELGDTPLPMADVLRRMQSSSANVRLAFLDSCRSGQVVTMKGGAKGKGFNIAVSDEMSSSGYAIITSSSENELSQESREIHGGIFTHYLISALRGAADVTNDGKVTLSEAYDYAFRRTIARTGVTVGGAQHPMYEFRLEGRGDIVITTTGGRASKLAVRLPESGRLLVVDDEHDTLIAEADLKVDETAEIALTAGKFQLYLVTDDGSVHTASVSLSPKQSAVLDAADFRPVELEVGIDKGGIFRSENRPDNTLLVGGMWRKFPLEGEVSSYGAAAEWRLRLPSDWQPAVRITWTTCKDVGLSTGYNDVGLSAGIGYRLNIRKVDFTAEVLAGYEHLLQSKSEGKARHTSGFDFQGMVGVALPTGPLVFGLDAGIGGRTFQVQDKGWVLRLDVQVVASIGYRWSW
jgi:hypothetical protein